MKKLQTLDSSYFRGKKSLRRRWCTKLFSISAMYRYFEIIAGVGNGSHIYYWKSKGLSDEGINYIKTSNYSVIPYLDYYGTKIKVKFNGICLK